ncbi:hypothetical protein [Glutamicibacter ardleyensis]|uniref:hypothetical protein n=1 Tax=Glutamicibacter ardleyensis TaxID=225894 RepID=UPI003FD489B2
MSNFEFWELIAREINIQANSYLRLDKSDGKLSLFDPDLKARAGFTTGLMYSSFMYFCSENEIAQQVAVEVAISALNKQLDNGGVAQPYNSKSASEPLVDIVEFGASAGNVAYMAHQTKNLLFVDSLARGSDYLLSQEIDSSPGAINKNRNTFNHIVVNASAYAANAWVHAYLITSDKKYLDASIRAVEFLIRSFRRSNSGWWPYSEKLDETIHLGRSVSYQSSIIALVGEVIGFLPANLMETWGEVATLAGASVVDAMKTSNDRSVYEIPSWSRDWENVFEIDWFLAAEQLSPEASMLAKTRLDALSTQIIDESREWADASRKLSSARTSVVTSTFRKKANLAGCVLRVLHQPGNIR